MQRPAPEALARKANEQASKENVRSEELALEILKLAVQNASGRGLDADTLLGEAERMWLWVSTDTWPPRPKVD